LLCTSTSAFAVGAGDIFGFAKKVEAYNTSDLMWGTASAKTITLSFLSILKSTLLRRGPQQSGIVGQDKLGSSPKFFLIFKEIFRRS
jgi:hypothetical protein